MKMVTVNFPGDPCPASRQMAMPDQSHGFVEVCEVVVMENGEMVETAKISVALHKKHDIVLVSKS
jgi:hypothetical protein